MSGASRVLENQIHWCAFARAMFRMALHQVTRARSLQLSTNPPPHRSSPLLLLPSFLPLPLLFIFPFLYLSLPIDLALLHSCTLVSLCHRTVRRLESDNRKTRRMAQDQSSAVEQNAPLAMFHQNQQFQLTVRDHQKLARDAISRSSIGLFRPI